MKGQTCADGQKQCKKALTRDATSPTVSTNFVLGMATIDAPEGRYMGGMLHHGCLFQFINGLGRENGAVWGVRRTNCKYFTPNKHTECDI